MSKKLGSECSYAYCLLQLRLTNSVWKEPIKKINLWAMETYCSSLTMQEGPSKTLFTRFFVPFFALVLNPQKAARANNSVANLPKGTGESPGVSAEELR